MRLTAWPRSWSSAACWPAARASATHNTLHNRRTRLIARNTPPSEAPAYTADDPHPGPLMFNSPPLTGTPRGEGESAIGRRDAAHHGELRPVAGLDGGAQDLAVLRGELRVVRRGAVVEEIVGEAVRVAVALEGAAVEHALVGLAARIAVVA